MARREEGAYPKRSVTDEQSRRRGTSRYFPRKPSGRRFFLSGASLARPSQTAPGLLRPHRLAPFKNPSSQCRFYYSDRLLAVGLRGGTALDGSRAADPQIPLRLAERCEVKIGRPPHFIFHPTSFCQPTIASQDAVSPILARSIPLGG